MKYMACYRKCAEVLERSCDAGVVCKCNTSVDTLGRPYQFKCYIII
jgi:hypothetical protein